MGEIQVEVVYLGTTTQFQKTLSLRVGSSAQQGLVASGVFDVISEVTADSPIGVYGQKILPGHILKDGDRLEIYRPLVFDPKEARRNRAARKKS